jgi:mRNA interferase MazF
VPHPQTPPRRGEIYWVDFNPVIGSEQAGRRPAVVISINSFNRIMRTVVVLPLTTTIRTGSPVAVVLPAGRPLREPSSILAFQPKTIDKSRLQNYAGALDAAQLTALEQAIKVSFGLT